MLLCRPEGLQSVPSSLLPGFLSTNPPLTPQVSPIYLLFQVSSQEKHLSGLQLYGIQSLKFVIHIPCLSQKGNIEHWNLPPSPNPNHQLLKPCKYKLVCEATFQQLMLSQLYHTDRNWRGGVGWVVVRLSYNYMKLCMYHIWCFYHKMKTDDEWSYLCCPTKGASQEPRI